MQHKSNTQKIKVMESFLRENGSHNSLALYEIRHPKSIVEETGLSSSTVNRHLKSLCVQGYLKRIYFGTYRITQKGIDSLQPANTPPLKVLLK